MFPNSFPVILLTSELLLKFLMVGVLLLSKKKSDSAKIAWMFLIIALPFIGTFIFLLVGTRRLGSRRRKRNRKILEEIPQSISPHIQNANSHVIQPQEKYFSVSHIASSIGGSAVLCGNDATLISESDIFIESLAEDIRNAKEQCHLLDYLMLDDKAGEIITESLIEANRRGVQCRLLLDSLGSKGFFNSSLYCSLKESGVQVAEALPVNILRAIFARVDLRNHRKIAVIDNTIGYMGSNNIAEKEFAVKKKFAPWVDASVRLTGPIVRELQAIFVQDWFMDTDEDLDALLKEPINTNCHGISAQLMATGPNSTNLALSQLLQTAFFSAQQKLVITTPYFSPDDATESALLIAAKRGVETHLVLPAKNDSRLVQAASRSRYSYLLRAGVQVHEYRGGLLHAKTVTIDDEIALIGSANLDRRSLDLNFEVSMLVYDSKFAKELRTLQYTYIDQSHKIPIDLPKQWSISRRLWQNAVSLIAPIL
ncbi:MAG: cardiolipin synthase [Phycisphaerae bacterium]|jgi:cardiolipin synthase A/B|nr:cardiolipin synthase [Phycisphaerae bacterium]